MIKVCHMTSAHDVEDVRIFHKECISLSRAGYEVYLVQRGDSYEKAGVHILGAGNIPASRRKRLTKGAKKVYEIALSVNADIYHFHDPELLPYGLKLKRAGKKVIFDSHEFYTEQIHSKYYLQNWLKIPIAKCYEIYQWYVLRQIDGVIYPCTLEGRDLFAGLCRCSAIVSNMAIIGEFFDRYDAKSSKKTQQICYVGGLTDARGITVDIKAAAAAGAKLVLAGSFSPEGYETELQAMPEFCCVENRGRLDRTEIAALLQQSVIGLCTLLDRGQYLKIDTFGVKVWEYLSMALPVILSNSPYNCAMVEKYQFGICVRPGDQDELAIAIRYLLDNPDVARQMGENGRKAVKEVFNWGVEEQKLLALYKDILR